MSKPKLLVADDSSTVRKVFELAFEMEGVEVLIASDGKKAHEMAMETPPSMIIADTDMPVMDGFDLCLALKNDERTRDIPVYLLASALVGYDQERADKAGADGKLEKPFRSEEMVRRVLYVLGHGPTVRAPLDEAKENEEADEESFEDFGDQVDWFLEKAEEELLEEEMEKIGPAVQKAVEELASSGELARIMEEVVETTVGKKLADGALEGAVARGVEAAVNRMKPEIMDRINKSAKEATLKVAEDLVKKTIDQIRKSGRP
ncbi:MAG: response regulator [Nitrospinota bacterium]|nr:response regulator [Nitrospinota bacterium]